MYLVLFLSTVPSDNPEEPFVPRQVIILDELTPQANDWVSSGRAVLYVRAELPELEPCR